MWTGSGLATRRKKASTDVHKQQQIYLTCPPTVGSPTTAASVCVETSWISPLLTRSPGLNGPGLSPKANGRIPSARPTRARELGYCWNGEFLSLVGHQMDTTESLGLVRRMVNGSLGYVTELSDISAHSPREIYTVNVSKYFNLLDDL